MAAARVRAYEPPHSLASSLAAFGTRRMVHFAQWRARREARAELAHGPAGARDQVFRGLIQINLIRPR